jgi:hypothetical protein
MFHVLCKCLLVMAMTTVEVILSTLFVGCTAQTPRIVPRLSTTSPSVISPAQPEPLPGKLSLAGLAYGPANTGQDPTAGVFPPAKKSRQMRNTYQRLVGVLFVWTPATHLDSVKDMLAVHFLAKVTYVTQMGLF